MNREEMIRMAREAGIGETSARFMVNLWEIGFEAGAAAEREACAKVCEDNEVAIYLKGGKSLRPRFRGDGSGCDGDVYAAAIRARGSKAD